MLFWINSFLCLNRFGGSPWKEQRSYSVFKTNCILIPHGIFLFLNIAIAINKSTVCFLSMCPHLQCFYIKTYVLSWKRKKIKLFFVIMVCFYSERSLSSHVMGSPEMLVLTEWMLRFQCEDARTYNHAILLISSVLHYVHWAHGDVSPFLLNNFTCNNIQLYTFCSSLSVDCTHKIG